MPTTPIGVPLIYLMLHLRRDGRETRDTRPTITPERREIAARDSDGNRRCCPVVDVDRDNARIGP